MENLLNILFPPRCLFCNKEGSIFCINCLEHCEPMENQYSSYLLSDTTRRLEVISCFKYEEVVRLCIKRSKYGAKQFAALKVLSEYGVHYLSNLGISPAGFTVVPIPLNLKKRRLRGFNQAELIAIIAARIFSLNKDFSLLQRIKDTRTQFGETRKGRAENVRDAFKIKENSRVPNKILLVDDICTTGATLKEAAGACYKAGAKEVKALTLSKAVIRTFIPQE